MKKRYLLRRRPRARRAEAEGAFGSACDYDGKERFARQSTAVTMIKTNTDKGCIRVSGEVFTALVGAAATNCFGVRGMAKRSTSDGLVHLLKKEAMGKGVHVTFHENENAISIELHIIVKTGVNIPVICDTISSEVRYKITKDTAVEVRNVDIFVDSIMPG